MRRAHCRLPINTRRASVMQSAIRDLLKAALRHRRNKIIVGEFRGANILRRLKLLFATNCATKLGYLTLFPSRIHIRDSFNSETITENKRHTTAGQLLTSSSPTRTTIPPPPPYPRISTNHRTVARNSHPSALDFHKAPDPRT